MILQCRLSTNLHQTLLSHVTDASVNNAVSTQGDPVCTRLRLGPASSPMHGAPSCMLYVTLSGIWKVRCLHTLEAVAVCMRLTISQFDTLANDTTALFNTNLLHVAA